MKRLILTSIIVAATALWACSDEEEGTPNDGSTPTTDARAKTPDSTTTLPDGSTPQNDGTVSRDGSTTRSDFRFPDGAFYPDLPAGTDTCADIFACAQSCTDISCVYNCGMTGCTSAQTLLEAVVTCALANGPDRGGDGGGVRACLDLDGDCGTGYNATCRTCLSTYCSTELNACTNQISC